MNIISTITGLIIAAVLYVPGTMQHEAIQVGEEPVVNEVISTDQRPSITHVDESGTWYFEGNDISDAGIPSLWVREQNEDLYECGGTENMPCSISIPSGQTRLQYLNTHANNIMAVATSRIDL